MGRTCVDLEMQIDEIERYGIEETIESTCVWATYESKQVMDNCRTDAIPPFLTWKVAYHTQETNVEV